MGTYDGSARIAGYQSGLDYVFSGGYQSTDGYVVAPGGSRKIGFGFGLARRQAFL